MEKDLSILTQRQKTVYLLRMKGMTYTKIGELLGISNSAATQHMRQAERRFVEFERFHNEQTQNDVPVPLSVTRGELKFILEGLQAVSFDLERTVYRRAGSDWLGRLPYEHHLVQELIQRLQAALQTSAR